MKNFKEYLNDTNPQVRIVMENGKTMTLELFPEVAPITVNNMLDLINEKFYDGIIFHRVIENFVIQGGDPTGTGMGGSEVEIKGEFSTNGVKNFLSHSRGVISMARTNMPNSASSQFFICHGDCSRSLDGSYAAFGALIDGFDTLDEIATTATDFDDKPIKEYKMKTIERVR